MKKLVLSAICVASLGLTACNDTTESRVESSTGEVGEQVEAKPQTIAINKLIADDENVKITLLEITKIESVTEGNRYDVVFEAINKRSDTIVLQVNSASADDMMIDTALLSMSTEITAGKMAKAKMRILERESYDFPEIQHNFEMVLSVFDWEQNYQEEFDVKADF